MFSKIGRWSRNESGGNRRSPSKKEVKTVEIDGRDNIWSVAFLDDGKHIISGGREGRIRRWRVEDGTEVGTPMDAGSTIGSLAVSPDGKWVVNGTGICRVTVWNAAAESPSKVKEFKGHSSYVYAADVSPDATRMATGSEDGTVYVWSLPAGQRLLGSLSLGQRGSSVVAVKFSPDGRLIAIATWSSHAVQIYDGQDGRRLVDVPIQVGSSFNQSLAWACDSKQLFVLSFDGNINCLDVSTGTTLLSWSIHSRSIVKCIALASNGTFIAASAGSSVSFWDTTTRKRIGSIIQHPAEVVCIAISANYDIVIGGDKKITLRNLYDVVPSSYYEDIFHEQEIQRMRAKLEESLRAQECSSNSKIAHLERTVQELHNELANSQHAANQKVDTLNETIKSLGEKDKSSNSKIAHLEKTVHELHAQLADSQHKANSLAHILRTHERKHQCEALYAEGRVIDAAESLLEIANAVSEDMRANKLLMDWLAGFTNRCISTLELIGDEASNVEKYDEAFTAYSTALSLSHSTPDIVLKKWAKMILVYGTVNKALGTATKFQLSKFVIYQTICDVLEGDSRVTEAAECFRRMQSELAMDTTVHNERAQWELGFQQRCTEKLEKLGDAAMDSRSYSDAAQHFSTILLLDPVDPINVLIKRSRARASMNSWKEALSDADEVIKLDPSCHQGYEMRHAALHGARRHDEAVVAFHMMLSKLEESPDERIRELRGRYVDATPTIRRIVEQTICHMPRVLIDTATGRLYDKKQQAETFEALPIYNELVSSMTTEIDYARILKAVKGFYRYVMFSHRWEYGEPLFQTVEHISIYQLEASLANIKLQTFCSLIRSFGFHWLWSDTCCINKKDNVVLQESLVAMFTWYHGSALTVVYLRGIWSQCQQPGDLQRSIWNTRAWTYQEYIAAETVQFYTEDWKPYLGLDMFNHKDSPVIISEMEQVSGVSVQDIAALRPGLHRVREKLYLASMRQTTLVEDIAYSLLGIFDAAIPVIYGEGNRAVGRLLEHILTGSGDVTILAWTGGAGRYNSCLPKDLTVYNQIVPPHIPQLTDIAEMDSTVAALRSSLPDLSLVVMLHNRLKELPSPSIAASRLRLPGIAFPLAELVRTSESDPTTNLHVYRAATTTFGNVEIKTADDLTEMSDLCLVHPWIRPLLDQEYLDRVAVLDETTQALRLVARLRQPFGALLFAQQSRVEYRRVAADSLIMVQVREEAPLTDLIDIIQTIEVQ